MGLKEESRERDEMLGGQEKSLDRLRLTVMFFEEIDRAAVNLGSRYNRRRM